VNNNIDLTTDRNWFYAGLKVCGKLNAVFIAIA
jgi:hypothetical protein